MISESEPVTYSRIPAARPLSSISILADRLKCSRLQDTFEKPESMSSGGASRRIKAVNFLSENCCWTNNNCDDDDNDDDECDCRREEQSHNFDSLIAFDPESDFYNNGWTHHRRVSENGGLCSSHQLCLSNSAPDGPLIIHSSDSLWIDSDRKSTVFYPPSTSCLVCQDITPPSKRSCRSLSASSASRQQKRSRDRDVSTSNNGVSTTPTSSGQSGRRGSIARPVALRSLTVLGVNSHASPAAPLKMDAQALIASGSVRLRNHNRIIIPPPSSRLSWHHPISSSGGPGSHPALSANQAHRRASVYPMGRNSILITDGGQPNELMSAVKLRKPPSLACLSSASTDFSHHRLSAFTPTQSRRISPHEGNQTTSDFSFSPDVVSSPCQHIASSASSGFFQESSFSHSFSASRLCPEESEEDQTSTVQRNTKPCIFSTSFGDRREGVFFSAESNREEDYYTQRNGHPSDGDTDESTSPSCFEQSPSYNSYSNNKRCQSQPNGFGNQIHQQSICTECTNQSILRQHLKRRRCSHYVVEMGYQLCSTTQNDATVSSVGGSLNEGVFVFGSNRSQQQLSESGTDTPVANLATETGKLSLLGKFTSSDGHMDTEVEVIDWNNTHPGYSVSPLRVVQNECGYCQDGCLDGPVFSILRRNELTGLSEASEEEELNESFGKRRQQLLEYDAGTLTPPIQTRFRPIQRQNSSPSVEENKLCPNSNFLDSSTEGSPCSFNEQLVKQPNVYFSRSPDNMFVGDSDGDNDDEDGGFVEITPVLSHRVKINPLTMHMQVDDHASALPDLEKYHELDIGLIEQD